MILTDDQTLDDIASALQTDTADLPNWWSGTNTSAHTWAYNQILGVLGARGYTLAQILASDQAPTWERRLTKWANIVEGGIAASFEPRTLAMMDCRPEMKETCLTASGVFVNPAGTAGQPATGLIASGNDLFSMDPDDTRRGKVTRF